MENIKCWVGKWKEQLSPLREVVPPAISVMFEVSLGWCEVLDTISEGEVMIL